MGVFKEMNIKENDTTVFQTNSETWWWEYSGLEMFRKIEVSWPVT